MDITSVFRTTVKGIKLAAKRSAKDAAKSVAPQGSVLGPVDPLDSSNGFLAPLKTTKNERGDFAQRCDVFADHLASLEQVLTAAQSHALRISGLHSSSEEANRARLDNEVMRALRVCQDCLATLTNIAKSGSNQQMRAHQNEVTLQLTTRLQEVVRAQRQYQRLCQQRTNLGRNALSSRSLRQRHTQPKSNTRATAAEEDAIASAGIRRAAELEQSLSPAECAQLTAENQTLFEEFEQLGGDLRMVESRLGEVVRLQEDFTCRVLEQDAALERITGLAVHSVENMSSGNEQLRSAMQNQASFRFWILFYLLVTSLTLWFLDWYNP